MYSNWYYMILTMGRTLRGLCLSDTETKRLAPKKCYVDRKPDFLGSEYWQRVAGARLRLAMYKKIDQTRSQCSQHICEYCEYDMHKTTYPRLIFKSLFLPQLVFIFAEFIFRVTGSERGDGKNVISHNLVRFRKLCLPLLLQANCIILNFA